MNPRLSLPILLALYPALASAAGYETVVQQPLDVAWGNALKTLITSGYTVASSATEVGLITTTPKAVRLTIQDVECGTFWGIPYIKDERTVTKVTYTVLVEKAGEGSKIAVSATVDGTYAPGAGNPDKSLTCTSKGTIEQNLLNTIAKQ